jgi:DNA-binding NarL/FixJ family response regulator
MQHTVLLVDDHDIVREGVKYLLELNPALAICGEAANGREAIEKVRVLKPDLVLMDLIMPVMGGIEATVSIRRRYPKTKIVVLSLHDSPQIAKAAKAAGANAYVTKSGGAPNLLKTINAVFEQDGSCVGKHNGRTRRNAASRTHQ